VQREKVGESSIWSHAQTLLQQQLKASRKSMEARAALLAVPLAAAQLESPAAKL
jgi:hypothetical protein